MRCFFSTVAGNAQVELSIEPVKAAFLTSEPLVFVAKLANGGNEKVSVDLGENRVGGFAASVGDFSNCHLYGLNLGGLRMVPNLVLKGGETYSQLLIVKPGAFNAGDNTRVVFGVAKIPAKSESTIALKESGDVAGLSAAIGETISKLIERWGPNSWELRQYLQCVASLGSAHVEKLRALEKAGVVSKATLGEALAGVNAVD